MPGRATLLIALTADIRALARRRCAPSHDQPVTDSSGGAKKGASLDLRPLTSRILAWETGSAFEAEAAYLLLARERLPHVYRAVTERWRAWFVRVNPDDEFPEFTKTNLASEADFVRRGVSLDVRRGAPPTPREAIEQHDASPVLLGPLRDKDAAGRFIEQVVDTFDLCRFYRTLVQAPHATACPYKEMGRCPAPCDGSEPMPSYRARVRAAADALARGSISRDAFRKTLDDHMRTAAATHDFEAAASAKAVLGRLAAFDKPLFAHICDVSRSAFLIAAPTQGGPPAARLFVFAPALNAAFTRLADVPLSSETIATPPAELTDAIVRALRAGSSSPIDQQTLADSLGLLGRWLTKPRTKSRVRTARLDLDADTAALTRALTDVLRDFAKGKAADALEEAELAL